MKKMLTALTLALLAGSAFAATTPAATTPAATPAPAAAKKTTHKATAAAPKCKQGEAVVKGKCEKKPA
jgi:cytochrome c5